MAVSVPVADGRQLEFSLRELTGAVGDSITVLPIVVALAALTAISLPHVLIVFGTFQIVWGVKYGLPVSVEPMKALAALAIAGTLSYGELAAAGLILGVVLLAIGTAGTLAKIERWIGEPVVRGVQLAVGVVLFETGLGLALEDPALASAGAIVALVVVALGYGRMSAIVVLIAGVAIAVATTGLPSPQLPGRPPAPPLDGALTRRTADGVVAQLAMTLGNAALATSLLFADLFDEDVPADDLASSMGVTNLIAIPAGGIPMCHGCDGVAGKYAFGARTGGANVVLGVGYVAVAFVATVIAAFPLSMLGVLLGTVAISLGKSAVASGHLALPVGIAVLALATNLGVAFLVGIVAHAAIERVGQKAKPR